ncbi:MAG: hypothetical protein ABEI27_03785 [Halobellus sp.]|uniref:hypothetical protein n=1 Tax=Halobellus sp. TaxID=1979212 RepID=UPI0035D3DD41
MLKKPVRERLDALSQRRRNLLSAANDLFSQEFSYSTGYAATVLNGCLFAPSLLTFWFVNGLIDFSTAITIGAVATPAGLQIRLLAYVLLVPTFFLLRIALHVLHPEHRRRILSGSCPNARLLSLDWFSMGILATGLPLALQDFGPWLGMNGALLLGLFVLPRPLSVRRARATKLVAIVSATALFLYAKYGSAVTVLPPPQTVIGPIATLSIGDATTEWLLGIVNSFRFGPLLVGLFGMGMNHILTRPELTELPLLHHTLPERDPDAVVFTSAALGTAFYLVVVAAATGTM